MINWVLDIIYVLFELVHAHFTAFESHFEQFFELLIAHVLIIRLFKFQFIFF